jgi:hypothetical protein
MKKMIFMLVLVATCLTGFKKAHAGVIISGGTTLGFTLIVSGAVGSVGTLAYGAFDSQAHIFDNGIGAGLVATFLVLAILDNGETRYSEEIFSTIPKYVFNDIRDYTNLKIKSQDYVVLQDGRKSVVFSQAEVDKLFKSVDENVDPSQLEDLRSLLTKPNIEN